MNRVLECDICGNKLYNKQNIYIEEAFLKQREGERERFFMRVVPICICENCYEGKLKRRNR